METNDSDKIKKPNSILKLDQAVINKIAAGEVIHRPFNVVKELIENSMDAGATNIVVTLKNGGMSAITIQDNGCGIKKEDLEIACHRFTTSKLSTFDDLQSLSTFGFRGEALSSISTVSHLTIITKTSNSVLGYKAEYIDGQLKPNSSITPLAANNGTKIIVENLFYNIPTRKAALPSETAEFSLVQDLIIKNAILHSQKCAFILKKHGDSSPAVSTNIVNTMAVNINNLFSQNISQHLLPLKLQNEKLCFKAKGFFSNGDLNMRKFHFLLFINNRLVECSALRNSIRDVYKHFLMKSGHGFVIMELIIDPKNIDVNIHPTKSEVCFLHQGLIFDLIVKCIEGSLRNKNFVQIPDQSCGAKFTINQTVATSNEQEKDLISSIKMKPAKSISANLLASSKLNNEIKRKIVDINRNQPPKKTIVSRPSNQVRTDSRIQRIDQYIKKGDTNPKRRHFSYDSLTQLCSEVLKGFDQRLLNLFCHSTYVGCADENFALIQHDLDLILVKIRNVNEELFYQISLIDFGNFNYINFGKRLSLHKLMATYFRVNAQEMTDVENRTHKMVDVLVSNRQMLDDYFSIKITTDGYLEAIPSLIESHFPVMSFLPDFVYRLSVNVDWENEKACFHSLATELSKFYARTPVKFQNEKQFSEYSQLIENKFYPLYKSLLFPSAHMAQIETFYTIANITDLYKVFERC